MITICPSINYENVVEMRIGGTKRERASERKRELKKEI